MLNHTSRELVLNVNIEYMIDDKDLSVDAFLEMVQ